MANKNLEYWEVEVRFSSRDPWRCFKVFPSEIKAKLYIEKRDKEFWRIVGPFNGN